MTERYDALVERISELRFLAKQLQAENERWAIVLKEIIEQEYALMTLSGSRTKPLILTIAEQALKGE